MDSQCSLPARRPTRAGLPLGRQPVPARYGPGVQGCREAFRYCLALTMVEAGKACLVAVEPGENGAVCVFESSAGEQFSLARPAITAEQEAAVKEMLREILRDEGWL
jgi:hypothetical protein